MRHSYPCLRLAMAAGCLAAWHGCQPIQRHAEPLVTEPEEAGEWSLPPRMSGGKPLMMHYMPWYKTPDQRGEWGSHWTGHERQHNPDNIGDDGHPDIWSHYHPLIGLYDSTDPDVQMCQLMQMKIAGVDGVIPDWYGISNAADYAEIHTATTGLMASVKKAGMYFAACYEDRSAKLLVDWGKLDPNDATNHLADTFTWMQKHWFSDPHYLRLNDRPVVLNFGPIFFTEPASWQDAMVGLEPKPALFCLHHLWRKSGADGGFSWIHYDPWEGTPDDTQIRNRINEVFRYFSSDPAKAIVSAYPGFYDVYAHESHPDLEHRNGATLRETLEVALAGPWPMVQVATWNDYGEGTMIEPTHEFGYLFLETIQDVRRKEIGSDFPFTADDLRLPAEVLARAKSGALSRSQTDQLWNLLANGLTEIARLQLSGTADN